MLNNLTSVSFLPCPRTRGRKSGRWLHPCARSLQHPCFLPQRDSNFKHSMADFYSHFTCEKTMASKVAEPGFKPTATWPWVHSGRFQWEHSPIPEVGHPGTHPSTTKLLASSRPGSSLSPSLKVQRSQWLTSRTQNSFPSSQPEPGTRRFVEWLNEW